MEDVKGARLTGAHFDIAPSFFDSINYEKLREDSGTLLNIPLRNLEPEEVQAVWRINAFISRFQFWAAFVEDLGEERVYGEQEV